MGWVRLMLAVMVASRLACSAGRNDGVSERGLHTACFHSKTDSRGAGFHRTAFH